jgi:major membrane immunogen (membrane-anchored lipoprotein)
MQRFLVIFLIAIIILTGCSIKKMETNDINKIVNIVLSNKSKLFNRVSNGYKYYLPKGIRRVDNKQYNEKLYTGKNIYYFYIDIVSYYYNKKGNYQINEGVYYSKILNYNDKEGYLEINQINDKYFIEMMYNYAKIEALVKEEDIKETIINFSYILGSIKYNDDIIQTMFNNDMLDYDEEYFDIFEPKRREGNFLDYINEYDYYEEEEEGIMSSDSIIME